MEIRKEYVVEFTDEEIKKIEDASNAISCIYDEFNAKISSFDGYLNADVENLDNLFYNIVEDLSRLRRAVFP